MQPQEIDALANALQLSISSKIRKVEHTIRGLVIQLAYCLSLDTGWQHFCRLAPGQWDGETNTYTITNIDTLAPSLTTFLLLTRLQKTQMQKLAALDSQYIPFVTKLQLTSASKTDAIDTVQDAVRVIFQRIEQQQMTLREVAEQSGLTQVSISNFKVGNDIKLSSLFKIAKVVGMKLRLD